MLKERRFALKRAEGTEAKRDLASILCFDRRSILRVGNVTLRVHVLAALAAATLASVGCGPSKTPPHEEETPTNIFLVRLQGGGLTRLTANREEETSALHPSWSPDGRRLMFARQKCESCPSVIDVVKLHTAHRTAGLRVGTGTRPRWSPDGTRVVFLDGLGDISVMDLGRSGVRELARTDLSDGASWSPDGRLLAFASRAGGARYTIKVISAAGTLLRRLAPSTRPTINPAWSPDGKRIAFARQEPNGRFRLYVVNRDGTGLRAIGSSELSATSPTWSPGGSKIAFIGVKHGESDGVYVMTMDGFHLHRLTPRWLTALQPAWSPRGEVIAFAARPSS